MTYNGFEVSAIARKLMADRNLDVREAARKIALHRTVVYDIIRGDRVSEASLREYLKGLEADEETARKILIAAGYEQPPEDPLAGLVRKARTEGKMTPEREAYIRELIEEIIREEDGEDETPET